MSTTTKSKRGGSRPGAGRPRKADPLRQIKIRIPAAALETLTANPDGMNRAREALTELADEITLENIVNTSD